MPDRPRIYVMCGLPGSGKTTFAKRFARKMGIDYLGVDDFYVMINGGPNRHDNPFEVWMAIFRALHVAEQDGRSLVFDTNAGTVCNRTQLLDWFPGFDHYLIHIRADELLCIRNNFRRSRTIPNEEMAKFIRDFQPPTPDEDERWLGIFIYENVENRCYEKRGF